MNTVETNPFSISSLNLAGMLIMNTEFWRSEGKVTVDKYGNSLVNKIKDQSFEFVAHERMKPTDFQGQRSSHNGQVWK